MITIMGHGKPIKIADLRKVKVERPRGAGSVWYGVSHGRLVDTIVAECQEREWEVGGGRFAIARGGADLVGALRLRLPALDAPDGIHWALGLIHSNARRMATRLTVGATVTVCDNGLVTGEVLLNKKHTMNLDLKKEVGKALDAWLLGIKHIPKFIKDYKQKRMKPGETDAILIEAGRQNLLPWSRLGEVDRRFGVAGSAWELLNAFTFIMKKNPANKQMDQIKGVSDLINTYL